jgi:hypothetical protein
MMRIASLRGWRSRPEAGEPGPSFFGLGWRRPPKAAEPGPSFSSVTRWRSRPRASKPDPSFLVKRALLGLAAAGALAGLSAATASAAPTVTLKAVPIPLRGIPGSGDILGAPAAVEFEFTIKGTESTGGVPSQLRGVNVWAPKGVKLTTAGFATCTLKTLELKGPEACPKKSQASALGSAEASDPIAGELIKEKGTVQAFFAPGGELIFYANAPSPISAQVYVSGSIHPASGLFAYEFESEIPLIESVPGAPAVSTEAIDIKVGSAFKKHGKVTSYITLPSKCPKGGFPLKAELKFESGESVVTNYKAPCPKRKRK